jgi:hypothetical protein
MVVVNQLELEELQTLCDDAMVEELEGEDRSGGRR